MHQGVLDLLDHDADNFDELGERDGDRDPSPMPVSEGVFGLGLRLAGRRITAVGRSSPRYAT
jgi:hypothetical protein